ncbi:hypothetical protein KBX06_14610 [Micromonospora sp. C31]|uniref:glycosyltransferase n=1 Tax=Micromonospora sp. C31 TaxID=2824876 RepID=UPI001B38935C|nr:nucleotide disphospho-sugar-binding domain-containing protein [Micromonospora sp. C31]MBQ1074386.1 hypothetical protein [Micromonospora sp. C31]
MRVLLVPAPLIGHVAPLLPLAAALRDAGHEVLVATAADGLRAVRPGLPAHDVAPGFDLGRTARRVLLRHPLIARAELAGTAGTRGAGLLFGAVNDQLADPVVAVAARVDAEFVLVRPDARLVRRRLPGNVRTVDWIPIPAALPASAALVHHGGAGSVLSALVAGVPQLATVGAGDRRHHAELVAARGAGIAARTRDITADTLARLVTDAGLRDAARQVGAEIAAMPGPGELVRRLESLR